MRSWTRSRSVRSCDEGGRVSFEVVGGQAAPIVASVEDGQKVVQGCMDAFGALHVVVNNAGIVRSSTASRLASSYMPAAPGQVLHRHDRERMVSVLALAASPFDERTGTMCTTST
jgi:NAD(P)-dependent dehydrogenase (short-subunit alcohol dehydrogenase family)